jgi:hypothetical protein
MIQTRNYETDLDHVGFEEVSGSSLERREYGCRDPSR